MFWVLHIVPFVLACSTYYWFTVVESLRVPEVGKGDA